MATRGAKNFLLLIVKGSFVKSVLILMSKRSSIIGFMISPSFLQGQPFSSLPGLRVYIGRPRSEVTEMLPLAVLSRLVLSISESDIIMFSRICHSNAIVKPCDVSN